MTFSFVPADPPLDRGINCTKNGDVAKSVALIQVTVKAFDNDASATVHDAAREFGFPNTAAFLKFVRTDLCNKGGPK